MKINAGLIETPKISIITPSYNQAQYLEDTILSVIEQNYPNLEYIIIDGGSTDNSVEIIKKYEKYLSFWVSEKDSGQSDAINKGIEKCTGEIFNWINSDDCLERDSLMEVARLYNMNPESVLFIGKLKTIGGIEEGVHPNLSLTLLKKGSYRNLPIRQQSNFFKLNYIRSTGGVNNFLHYCMDAELIFRLLCSSDSFRITSTENILGCYRIQPESKGATKIWDFVDELNIIYKEIANKIANKKMEMYFDSLVKDREKQELFSINQYDFNENKAEVLLNYQICNWIDYYYFEKKYAIVKQLFSLLEFSKIIFKDQLYYRKLKLNALLR